MSERGQALVETALSLSILVFLLLGGADFARVFAAQVGVLNAARSGVEAGVIKAAGNDAAIVSYAQDELGRVPGLDVSRATITVTHTQDPVTLVSYVNVEVAYPFRTLVAWPLVPSTVNLDRTATMRVFP